jgi:hypothetical protein
LEQAAINARAAKIASIPNIDFMVQWRSWISVIIGSPYTCIPRLA